MKQILDLVPVLAFVAAYFTTRDFQLATIVIVVASAAQMAISWTVWKKVERLHWITFIVLVVMGGLTAPPCSNSCTELLSVSPRLAGLASLRTIAL